MIDKPITLYSILRPRGLGYVLLLSATGIDEAAAFMRSRGLVKSHEKRFADSGLVQWVVQ